MTIAITYDDVMAVYWAYSCLFTYYTVNYYFDLLPDDV